MEGYKRNKPSETSKKKKQQTKKKRTYPANRPLGTGGLRKAADAIRARHERLSEI